MQPLTALFLDIGLGFCSDHAASGLPGGPSVMNCMWDRSWPFRLAAVIMCRAPLHPFPSPSRKSTSGTDLVRAVLRYVSGGEWSSYSVFRDLADSSGAFGSKAADGIPFGVLI
ncbi:hypothetical protein PYCCODRAFT_652639 [Trametes coccinea BRFM310]|uniref:Uncharacterized protein n=1 Tax=Trametes coccinea (strain BRFM310) TaxID=1353009 RepID=A0A1Y2IJ90_TRAC3|nr:hypothetical protein PYCCODRAFT_652639 [Trametes coccinea BRFM310]